MNNGQTEVNCKAKLTEAKNGDLIITLFLDEYDRETAVIEYGKIPKGSINQVVVEEPNDLLTPNEEACKKLTDILKKEGVGEFKVRDKIFVEVYNEPRRE